MITRLKSMRKRTAAVAILGVLGAAAAAIAYFSTTGSGTGSASVGTSSAVTIHGSTTGTLYPGTNVPVTFTIDNPSSGHQYVGTITLASVDTPTNCSAADFTMPDVTVNHDYASGNGQSVTPQGTLTMANTAVSQDACKNGSLTLHFTSN